ncbi:Hypothetical protein CAP_5554 [Chondromyces apiculatus DSM 436]|uniref:Uncharacterized protein n=1 Tax=Chondromyces apiculatus DSM 436 TaxID=1192034 RepID=A0A017T380_9BACT|nr:Hypothetical protein CAP_5554 [Chondromyces apiculatus DSM 436]
MPSTSHPSAPPSQRVNHVAFHTHRNLLTALVALPLAVAAAGCSGIDAGVDYPDNLPVGEVGQNLLTPENEADPSVALSQFKIKPDVCKGIETHVMTQPLAPDDLARFLEGVGASVQPKKARGNLYWFDFPASNDSKDSGRRFVRLRLAVLDNGEAASRDLHDSLLLHGPGWWGVRRSNLAVLAPKADLDEALAFAIKYKLVCWGVFTYAGNDDTYVVPGPYLQF